MLRDHFQTEQIFAVHRIDRETSGCLLFARGKEAEGKLKELFEKHALKRVYFAIVEGRMQKKVGTWQSRLLELESLHVVESDTGREAITHFSVLKHSPKYTYLKLTLETGRKHQIRVHCSAAGYPVLGDTRYGASEDPIRRMCLHARHLELVHPFTGKMLMIESPVPTAFKKIYAFANTAIKNDVLASNS
jgi:tRNA pseudouridine32 synthase/23S rRNA pseudouridine746 synthase/23S rRNA pseudouridine1911/1915/1917 synthase